MASNFVEIVKEIRGSTLDPATDPLCIYGELKNMHAEYETFNQITDAERLKLSEIESEATKNSTDEFLLNRSNHTGTQSADFIVDGSTKLLMTSTERLKLSEIESKSTKNSTDIQLRDRSTHTGTQSADTLVNGSINSVFTITEKNKLATLNSNIGDANIVNVNWSKITNTPTTYSPSAHNHSMNDISSGTLSASRIDKTLDLQFVSNAEKVRIAGSEIMTNKGVPFGYVPLDGNGKINASYLNNLNIQEVFTPVNESGMLLLTSAAPGDIAYRQDNEKSYMLIALPSNVLSNWKVLNTGANIVSINGQTGIVVLSTDNVAEGKSNLYFTNERVDDRVNSLLKAGKNLTLTYDDNLNELTISLADTVNSWSAVQNKPDPTITVNISGDISGSGSVKLTDLTDGTLNITNMTLENAGTVGTYRSVTTDAQGRVVSGTNPTTISGYGIADAYTKTEINSSLALKVDKVAGKGLSTEDYTSIEKTKLAGISASANNYSLPVATNTVLGGVKAGANVSIDANGVISANDSSVNWSEVTSKPTTVAGYGITDSIQSTLVSGTNIKTINSQSLLGSGNISTVDTTKLPLTGGTMTGAITAIRETKVAMAANNIDLATGNLFTKTISGVTTLTISNALAAGNVNSFVLELTNGGSAVITWFSGVKWAGGTAPTLTASGKDILGFYSHDGGTTWNILGVNKDVK